MLSLLVEGTLVVLFAKSEFCHTAFTAILCNALLLFFLHAKVLCVLFVKFGDLSFDLGMLKSS